MRLLYSLFLLTCCTTIVARTQTYYTLGGTIYLQGHGDIVGTSVKPTLRLDSTRSTSTSFMGGYCNYAFDSVPSGLHRLQITSLSTVPLDTMIMVDHGALCGSGDSTYNVTVKTGMNNRGRQLTIPDVVNTLWRYSFLSTTSSPQSGYRQQIRGTHSWRSISRRISVDTTTLLISAIQRDSVFTHTALGDTTELRTDTLSFPIIITGDSIRFSCPDVSQAYQRIPRYCLSAPDTLQFVWPEPVPSFSSTTYRDSIGISAHTRRSGGNNSSSVALSLIDCIVGTSTGFLSGPPTMSAEFVLEQNYPNPFNPSTTIRFSVPSRVPVTLKVYDVLGRQVTILMDAVLGPGRYEATLDGTSLASGVYFYRVQAGAFTDTKRLMVLR